MLDHVVTHLVADSVDVPIGPPQQPLHPVRRHVTGLLGQSPAVLTIKTRDKPRQILPRPASRLRPGEPIRKAGMQPVELTRPLINLDHRHASLNEPIIDTYRLLSAVAVLSLFYVGLNPSDPLGFRVYTMSRWGYSSPENSDLSQMLQGLEETARRFIAAAATDGRRWDPRGSEYPLVNIGDFPAFPALTRYVGLDVQTLDTDRCRWSDILDKLVRMDPTASIQGLRRVPHEAAALLVDGSVLRVVNDHNELQRRSQSPNPPSQAGP